MSNSAVVDLLSVPEAAQKKCHAKNEKQVGQDGAKERSLYDADLILDERNDEDDQFDGVAESDVEKCTKAVAETAGHAFGGVAKQTCERYDGDSVQSEDDGWAQVSSLGGNTDRHEDEQDVDPAVAESILGVDDKAFAGLGGTCGDGRFGG